MCDDLTLADMDAATPTTPTEGFSRRNFALVGGAAALASFGGAAGAAARPKVVERAVSIPTPDGTADAILFHPAKGRHPGIVMWPDIAGIRDANKLMARRLAAAGHAVLLVNQYYRSAKAPVLASFAHWRTPEGQARLKPMIAAITPEGTTRDGAAFVAWLDRQGAVHSRRGIGACGYCMGGPFAVRTAVAAPGRVRAAASLHGGGLVSDSPTSPHRLLGQTKAAFLVAIARNDDARTPADKTTLAQAAAAAGRKAEIEVYQADHGWTVPDSPVYDHAAAERAWSRMLALFAGL